MSLLPKIELDLGELNPKQELVFKSHAQEKLFGGAAGPGKSHLLRILAITICTAIPYAQVYLFRRNFPDLISNHMDGPSGFRALLAPWVNSGLATITERDIRFNKFSSEIHLRHCDDPSDVYKYQGAEMHALLIDEATHFEENMIRYLRTRVRAWNLKIPPEYAFLVPQIVYASNPGGPGHGYFKRAFVDPETPGTIFKAPDDDGGLTRQYIRALLSDNPFADYDTYSAQIKGIGSPELVRAYLDGDWNINLGCFFREFSHLNIISPFPIPSAWTKARGMDWGGLDPLALGWMTVTPEDFALEESAPREQRSGYFNEIYHTSRRIIPKNSRILYREWYIADEKDKGIKISNYDLARGICDKEHPAERVLYGVTGRDSFIIRGGPSIAEQLNAVSNSLGRGSLFTRPADTRRPQGWQEMRSRMIGREGYPEFYVFSTCRHTIRLIPAMQVDESKLELGKEDALHKDSHINDMLRYLLMSYLTANRVEHDPNLEVPRDDWSLNYLWEQHAKNFRFGFGL